MQYPKFSGVFQKTELRFHSPEGGSHLERTLGSTDSLFSFAASCFFTFSRCALAETPPVCSPAFYTHGSKGSLYVEAEIFFFYKILIGFVIMEAVCGILTFILSLEKAIENP